MSFGNRYKVVKDLGAGNFSVVHLVEDFYEGDLKALKKTYLKNLKKDAIDDTLREGKLLATLKHDHITNSYESFMDGNYFCIITEYCEIGDLEHRLKELSSNGIKLPEDFVLIWFRELILGVEYIHSKGIIHRDIKPSNIYIKNEHLKLGDFGLAKALMNPNDWAATFAGTPLYMSPEVVSSNVYDKKTDIWSSGCVLCEMCTYEVPFTAANLPLLCSKVLNDRPRRLPEGFSEEIKDLYSKMLAKRAAERPSATEVLNMHVMNLYVQNNNNNINNNNNNNSRNNHQNAAASANSSNTVEIPITHERGDSSVNDLNRDFGGKLNIKDNRPLKIVYDKEKKKRQNIHCYTLQVTTKDVEGAGNVCEVYIVLYGSKGCTDKLYLKDAKENNFDPLQKNRIEIFDIFDVPDIGKISQCHVCYDDYGNRGSVWFLVAIEINDIKHDKHYSFECNKPFSLTLDDKTIYRVLTYDPRTNLNFYQVIVYTSEKKEASSDGNLFVTLIGENGDSGERPLRDPLKEAFKRGKVSIFTVESIDLGDLKEIIVRNDFTGNKEFWMLEQIIVEHIDTERLYTFVCNDAFIRTNPEKRLKAEN